MRTTPEAQPPAIHHPVDPADAADAAVPPLPDSDAAAWDALAGLVGDGSVLDVLLRDHLIQRLVVMIDNLPEPRIATRALAMRPLPGAFATGVADGTLQIAEANAQRYEPYVRAFEQADPARLAAVYRRFYPLFQPFEPPFVHQEADRPPVRAEHRPRFSAIEHLVKRVEHEAITAERNQDAGVALVGEDVAAAKHGRGGLGGFPAAGDQRDAGGSQVLTLRAALGQFGAQPLALLDVTVRGRA